MLTCPTISRKYIVSICIMGTSCWSRCDIWHKVQHTHTRDPDPARSPCHSGLVWWSVCATKIRSNSSRDRAANPICTPTVPTVAQGRMWGRWGRMSVGCGCVGVYDALTLGRCCHGVAFGENANSGLCSKSLGRPPFVNLSLFLPPDGLCDVFFSFQSKVKEVFCKTYTLTIGERTTNHYQNYYTNN